MEIEIYHKGKRFIANSLEALDKRLRNILGEGELTNIREEELTNIRFELIVKMLEADERLRKRVKGFVLTYC